MEINSWNCRGLGNSYKAEAVTNLLKLAPSEILLLQETKIDGEAILLIGKNRDHLHFWQARRRDRRMLDKVLIPGFYEPKLVDARWCFHIL